MDTKDWWKSGVVYQVYPRSFGDTDGDGVGDLRGVTERLQYLEWLGVDAVWLSPFYPSPMADFGYDVSDYTDVDPMFGTLADFDVLVEEAHRRGLRVIVDYVPNHTSDEHPWFVESRSSRENPKRDWYIWRDAKPDGSPPNNWQSNFGGGAWEWDGETGQYYLHLFDVKQPDLNWRNPEVREAMYGVMRFWLDRGVDGFRIDVLNLVIKDEHFRDDPENPDWREGDRPWERLSRVYSEDRPEMLDVIREMRAVADAYDGRVLIGEIYLPVNRLVSYYGPDLDGVQLPFNFGLVTLKEWGAEPVRRLVEEYEAALPDGAWPNWVLGNHDNPRIAGRVGEGQACAAAMLLLTLRGTPTMYYGDEIGLQDVEVPPELAHDPQGKNPGYGRDKARTPMQWSPKENAGFAPPGADPWLPLSPDYESVNVATQENDDASILSLYRKLLELRRTEPALHAGEYEPVEGTPEGCYAYVRRGEDRRLLVALNFSGEYRTLELAGRSGRVVLSTHLDREGDEDLDTLDLRAGEGCIVELGGA